MHDTMNENVFIMTFSLPFLTSHIVKASYISYEDTPDTPVLKSFTLFLSFFFKVGSCL